MANKAFNCLLPLNFNITIPIYTAEDIVQRRSFLMDEVIRTKLLCDELDSNEVVSPYADKLKAQTERKNRARLADESDPRSHSESSLLDKRKDVEEFTLIWLDQRLDADKPDVRNLAALRDAFDSLLSFTDINSCCEYISKIPHNNVYLIISGTIGRNIVPIVHGWRQIRSIYVLCQLKDEHRKWASAHAKIRPEDIFNSVNFLIERLRTDLFKCQKVHGVSYKIERSVFDVHSNEADFRWSYRLTQTLISWPRSSIAQDNMIAYMRDYCKESQPSTAFIDKLSRDYIATEAIRWYTMPGCLFFLVNRAFRNESIDEIFKYRSFIKDLSEQITLLHNEQREYGLDECCVYRGTCLPYDDIAVLKANQGKLISFNGFLSTSLEEDTAVYFIQPSDEQAQLEGVLFEYYVNASLETSAYAHIGSQSAVPHEQEILFDIGSIFRIESMKYDSNKKIWRVRCILCDKKDCSRLNINGASTSQQGFLTFVQYGHLLSAMGDFQRAQNFFHMLLKEASQDSAKAICLFGLADIYLTVGDRIRFTRAFNDGLKYCSDSDENLDTITKSLHLYRKLGSACTTAGHFNDALNCFAIDMSLIDDDSTIYSRAHLALTVGAAGSVYFQVGDYARALECYQQEAKLAEELYTDTIQQANLYERFGCIHLQRQDFDEALKYFGKALDVARKQLPSNHIQIQILNHRIGFVYLNKGYLSSALEYFITVLDFCSKIPELSIITVEVYTNLGSLYALQDKFDLSFTFYNKAIALHLERHPASSHPTLAAVYVQIASSLRKQCKFEMAESFLLKAYAIYQKCDVALKIGECLADMSSLYAEKGDMMHALICLGKTLSINKRICGESDISVAIIYKNMSAIWLQMNDTEKALQFIARSLMIFTLFPAIIPIECSNAYEVLGCIYLKKSNYLLAIKYFKTTLKIRKAHLPRDYSQVWAAYYRLGQAYTYLHRFDTALQYYQKAIVAGGESYLIDRELGDMYCIQNKNDQALESYEKALAAAKLKYEESHSEIAKTYSRLGNIYCSQEKYKLAAECFMKTVNYYENNTPNDRANISTYSMTLANILLMANQYTMAIVYFELALKNLPETDSKVLEIRWIITGSYKELADNCNEKSDFLKALEYYEHALRMLKEWFPLRVDAIKKTESCIEQILDGVLKTNRE